MKMSELNIPRSELEHLIAEYVWNARNKKILYDKVDGYTYEEIAEKYHLSTVRIKEIVQECLIKISNHT